MKIPTLLLVLAPVVLSLAVSRTRDSVYFAPVEILTEWQPLDPGSVDCGLLGRRMPVLDKTQVVSALVWTGHSTESVSGYFCTGVDMVTTCSVGFWGGQTVVQTSKTYTPGASQCSDEYVKYIDHHEVSYEHPLPECSWLSSMPVTRKIIRISPLSLEYDPFRDEYRDHRLAGGRCLKSPCLTNSRDALWFNTTAPIAQCSFGEEIELSIGSTSTDSVHQASTKISSLSLMATSFVGSCKMQMCEKDGYRLATGEWVHLVKESVGGIPPCLNNTLSVNTLSAEGLIRHAISEYEVIEESRRCNEVKEKLMAGEGVSRSEISNLQPQVIGKQPVYRHDDQGWWTASALYDLVVYPKSGPHGVSVGTLGVRVNSTKKVIWHYPYHVSKDLVDGPNGMFWYRGGLQNPKNWESTNGVLFNITRAEFRSVDAMKEAKEKEEGSISDWINEAPNVMSGGTAITVYTLVGLALVGLLVAWCVCKPIKTRYTTVRVAPPSSF